MDDETLLDMIDLKKLVVKIKKRKEEVEKFLDYLKNNTDFFTAPASSKYHSAYEGGLLHHSILVTKKMLDLNEALNAGLDEESIVIAGLFHDVGKIGFYKWNGFSYERVGSKTGAPHEILSLVYTSKFLDLTPDESHAILYHNGLYTPLGQELRGKERPLTLILHFADMWCSRFVEIRPNTEMVENGT